MIQHFSIASRKIPADLQDCFSTYKLLCWTKEFIQYKIKSSPSPYSLVRYGKEFYIIWNTPRGHFLQDSLDSEWWVSFREAKPEFNIPAYAIIWRAEDLLVEKGN